MKKSLFLLLLIYVAACNNIEKSREAILTASNEHDVALELVRDLGRNMSGELERWSYYQGEIMKTENAGTATVAPENRAQLDTLLRNFSDYNGKFSAFIQEVSNFAKAFEEQRPELDTMKLALGGQATYDGNLNRTLAAIRETNAATASKVQAWEARLTQLSQEIEAKYKEIRALQGLPVE